MGGCHYRKDDVGCLMLTPKFTEGMSAGHKGLKIQPDSCSPLQRSHYVFTRAVRSNLDGAGGGSFHTRYKRYPAAKADMSASRASPMSTVLVFLSSAVARGPSLCGSGMLLC